MVIEAFEAWPFDPNEARNVCELLRLSLVTLGASRIYELRENHHANHEIDAEAMEAVYWGRPSLPRTRIAGTSSPCAFCSTTACAKALCGLSSSSTSTTTASA
jgi:hypothetical protein